MRHKKKKLGSYPYLSVVFSITMALFVIGLFALLILFAQKLTEVIREKIEVQVYLNHSVSEEAQTKILRAFYKQPYVAKKGNKSQIYFVSRDTAAARFIRETGEDFKKFLGENPLRDAFIIRIDADFSSKKQLKAIKTELEAINGVYEVVYVESLIDAINQNIRKISLILLSFALILVITVFLLINSTIKLALFSQRFLIRSMQLVGARPLFIQWPFLSRAAVQGFVSGLIASAMLGGLIYYANTYIPDLEVLEDQKQILFLMGALLVLGSMLGLVSSFNAVNKYLKMSLDQLY